MQVNLFKVFAIIAALSTVQSAPVETTEDSVTREQIDGTHINKAVVDDAVPQKGCVREKAPRISTRVKEGRIFARACYDHDCVLNSDCKKWGCTACRLHFVPCGDSFLRCN